MRRPTSYLPRLAAAAAIFAAAGLAWAPASARADILFSISAPSSVAAGSTNNTLEIWLTSTAGSSTVVVGGFSFGITSSQPGVTFTSATTATSSPYIFGADSLLGPVIDDGPGTTITGGDVSTASGTSVTAGSTFGLALVKFDVSSGSTGAINFSFVTTPQSNTLSSPPPTVSIPIAQFVGATTTITNTTAVPEPSVMALTAVALAAAAARLRRRKAG